MLIMKISLLAQSFIFTKHTTTGFIVNKRCCGYHHIQMVWVQMGAIYKNEGKTIFLISLIKQAHTAKK